MLASSPLDRVQLNLNFLPWPHLGQKNLVICRFGRMVGEERCLFALRDPG